MTNDPNAPREHCEHIDHSGKYRVMAECGYCKTARITELEAEKTELALNVEAVVASWMRKVAELEESEEFLLECGEGDLQTITDQAARIAELEAALNDARPRHRQPWLGGDWREGT